jgi:ferric-dicitrate binding protein FerR (iron transport regulator)
MKSFDYDQLVRELGESLDQQKSYSFDKKSGLSDLNGFKKEWQQSKGKLDSSKLWDRIESATKPKKTASIYSINAIITWAVAAALLVASIITLMKLDVFAPQAPATILAQTQAGMSTISIDDEAEITLRNFSQLTEISNSEQAFEVDLQGEARFQVQKRKERVFRIKTNQGFVSVLGTTFYVLATDSLTRVYLEEGSIQVDIPELKDSRRILPGEVITFTKNRVLVHKRAENQAFTAWTQLEMNLESRSISDVLDELERHYDIRIQRPNNILKEQLSGVILLRSLENVFIDLQNVVGGTFVRQSENSYQWNLSD